MNLSGYIDQTLLKPEATSSHILQICQEAKDHQFFAVCVNSSFVSLCSQALQNSEVKIASVVGFPLGAMDTLSKSLETQTAIKNGANEIDMVIHLGHLKEKNYKQVEYDISEIVKAAHGNCVKVILETGMLTQEEKKIVCELSVNAHAHFVKTCTGFNKGTATIEDVQLMKSIVKNQLEIKASGGIKNTEFALELIAAGASRLGTSSGVALIKNQHIKTGSY